MILLQPLTEMTKMKYEKIIQVTNVNEGIVYKRVFRREDQV